MIIQTEMLVFSDDEYTDLVRTFQAFPHRPNLSNVLRNNLYDEQECATKALDDRTKTLTSSDIENRFQDFPGDTRPQGALFVSPVQEAWYLWATRIEEIHRGLAEQMSRCKLRLAKQDETDFGLAHLSISSDLPKNESLTGLLHKMLDSASEPDEPEDPKTGLEGHMQLMGF